ncbi:hypothetical protein NQ315_015639 [Exocentrus adspersus]|uniref:Uncharacterized protein n=1 Tax=Exocentrus adspersus TaxID=1586481 RepID=A0AAV8W3J1_9CUCU|nr:hypothetical protein NQ315_015639 [Exocentrus adspersus]
MSTSYSTALSHIILAGTGIYCLIGSKHFGQKFFPRGSFGIIILHSAIGIWRWGNPSYGQKAAKLYKLTSLLQDLIALPCIVTTIWLSYGYMWQIAYAYTLASLFPLVAYMCDHNNIDNEMTDVVIGANCISLGVLAFIHQNYFGVAASISYAFTHFVIKNDNETYFNITSQDLYNYAMCFFAFFALKTVLD